MRKTLGIWVPIALLAILLGGVYLRQWLGVARSFTAAKESQKKDIALLTSAVASLRDISALQMALRVKLFGPNAAEEAAIAAETGAARPAEPMPPSLVAAMNRHAVRLVYFRQSSGTSRMQFEGPYENMVRFLSSAGPDLPRIDGFLMERSDRARVRLTLSFTVAA